MTQNDRLIERFEDAVIDLEARQKALRAEAEELATEASWYIKRFRDEERQAWERFSDGTASTERVNRLLSAFAVDRRLSINALIIIKNRLQALK